MTTDITTDITTIIESKKESIISKTYKIVPKRYIDEELSKADDSIDWTRTSGVKKEFVDAIRSIAFNITILPVRPILPMLNCHANSMIVQEVLIKHKLKVEVVIGYNVTACVCGRLKTMEVHSTIKYNDKYYDFTADFGKEKCKYFIPIVTKEFNDVIPFVTYMKFKDFDMIHICDVRNHECNANKKFGVPSAYRLWDMQKVEKVFCHLTKVQVISK